MGFARACNREFRFTLHYLERMGALTVKQGGFIGDSMHHPKIVIMHDVETVYKYFHFECNVKNEDKVKESEIIEPNILQQLKIEEMEENRAKFTKEPKPKILLKTKGVHSKKEELLEGYKFYCNLIDRGRCKSQRFRASYSRLICIWEYECTQKSFIDKIKNPLFIHTNPEIWVQQIK